MEEVKLALEHDIEKLEEEFEILQGYVRGMEGCMYVSYIKMICT